MPGGGRGDGHMNMGVGVHASDARSSDGYRRGAWCRGGCGGRNGRRHRDARSARYGSRNPAVVSDLAAARVDPAGYHGLDAATGRQRLAGAGDRRLDAGSPEFRQYLTVPQFAARFGATADALSAVESALVANGLTVGDVPANHLTIPASGTAAQIEQAFSVSMQQVKLVVRPNDVRQRPGAGTARRRRPVRPGDRRSRRSQPAAAGGTRDPGPPSAPLRPTRTCVRTSSRAAHRHAPPQPMNSRHSTSRPTNSASACSRRPPTRPPPRTRPAVISGRRSRTGSDGRHVRRPALRPHRHRHVPAVLRDERADHQRPRRQRLPDVHDAVVPGWRRRGGARHRTGDRARSELAHPRVHRTGHLRSSSTSSARSFPRTGRRRSRARSAVAKGPQAA